MNRNLMFYCYPRTAGQKWRRSVKHLLKRWSIFTGRKLVTVAVDECCDDHQDVHAAFGPAADEIEWTFGENAIDVARKDVHVPASNLQEAAHFGAMLRALETTDHGQITLYCHAKGCTHAADNAPSHKWCDAMAAACLDYPELIDCAMSRGNCCGAFRVHSGWEFEGYRGRQHFAGSWYWFRNSRVLELGVHDCPEVFYGTEGFPGLFPIEETVCTFYDNANSSQLYQNSFWNSDVFPSLKHWQSNLAKCGLVPLSQQTSEKSSRSMNGRSLVSDCR